MERGLNRFLFMFGTLIVAMLALNAKFWYGLVVFKRADYMNSEYLPDFVDIAEASKNDILRRKVTKIGDGMLEGPETVVSQPGTDYMFTFSKDGVISRLDSDGVVDKFMDLKDHFNGTRPLGAAFGIAVGEQAREDSVPLYIADAVQGLVKVTMDKDVKLVSTVANDREIKFANDVAVGPISGHVYFTDSSDIAPPPMKSKGSERILYDTLGASIEDFLRSRRTGRLLKFDPISGETTELLDEIWFANGVTVSKDEDYVLVCETFAARVLKVEVNANGGRPRNFSRRPLPGYCDGINYSIDGKSVLVSIPSPPPLIARLLKVVPAPLAYLLRCVVILLPPSLRPAPLKAGIVAILDSTGKTTDILSDPAGNVINMISSVTEDESKPGRLLLGNLEGSFVGAVDYAF